MTGCGGKALSIVLSIITEQMWIIYVCPTTHFLFPCQLVPMSLLALTESNFQFANVHYLNLECSCFSWRVDSGRSNY